MKTVRETIDKIEETLANEINSAAIKRDLNKMVLALSDSVKHLVDIAKEMASALEGVAAASTADGVALNNAPADPVAKVAAKKPAAKKPAAKKAPARTQKQPIQPK